MKCLICGKKIIRNVYFSNLFIRLKEPICETCKEENLPDIYLRVFPIKSGIIKNYYLFESKKENSIAYFYYTNILFKNFLNSNKIIFYIDHVSMEFIRLIELTALDSEIILISIS